MRKNLIIPGLMLLTAALLGGCQDQLAPPTGLAGSAMSDVGEPGRAPARFQPLADVSTQQTDGLQTMVTETGMVSASVDGVGTLNASGTVQIDKPAGATVRGAYFAAASTGFESIQLMDGEVQIDGAPISWDVSLQGPIDNWNHWAEVTEHVREKLDAAPAGLVEFTISQNRPAASEGLILGVIFNDPNRDAENTVVFLFGRQRTTGDEFLVNLANPIDKDDPNLRLTMGLGISYGFQPSGQVSLIDVNGERLTSSAGGQDDAQGTVADGSLLTVGGVGDSPDNPPPFADATDPRTDDELYNLVPFVDDGDTQIRVFTRNPSNDDNIYFAWFDISEVGGVDCIPVTINRIWSSGTDDGTISLSSFETFAAIFNVETFLPRPASPSNVRLAEGDVDETSWEDGTPAQRFFLTDLNDDGNRDVVVVFRTQRLMDEGNLSMDTERITLWGRDPNTGSLFCATGDVTVIGGEPEVLFYDNFDQENNGVGQLNFFGFTQWNVVEGSVDLLGPGLFDLYPGNGLYVDLDGSTGNAGRMETKTEFTLTPATYVLEFQLGGSQRGDTNTVEVSLGGVYSESFTLPSAASLTTYTRSIPVGSTTSARIVFDHAGGDSLGLILTEVRLTRAP